MISVIVPVYNVEKYLDKCIQSILSQTYTDFELILVDDGSPDNCPEICDNYAITDSRIRVIHKENGGLSSARNEGMRIAKGEWYVFVDSDDYIDEKMLAVFAGGQEKTGADIVVCDFVSFIDGFEPKRNENADISVSILDSHEAVKNMFHSKGIGHSAWCKMYHKKLFNSVEYPIGMLCEDKATTYKLYLAADKIAYIPKQVYYYRLRKDSITGVRSSKIYLDTLSINEDICQALSNVSEELYGYACGCAAKNALLCYSQTYLNDNMAQVVRKSLLQLKKYYKYVKNIDAMSRMEKIVVYVTGKSIRKKDSSIILDLSAKMLGILKRSRDNE